MDMKYRYCGKSGLQLPVISLGMWHNFGGTDPYERGRQIAFHAFDRGVTHFDLANNYGPPPGSAEENFGKMLRDGLSTHRDEIIVTSKAGHEMWNGPYGDGSSRKHLMASINQSLRRTGLEYFDIFYSLRYNPDTPLEETMQALVDIVRQGKALYVGLSKYPVDVAEKACAILSGQNVPCLVYQDRYSMMARKPESEHIGFLRKEKIGFVAFSPLAQGLLTGRYLNGIPSDSRSVRDGRFLHKEDITEDLVARLRGLDGIAKRRGQTLAQMALSWLLAKPAVTSVIVGASSVTQLDDSLEAINAAEFIDTDLAEIDSILKA